jgi:hypothetical protein
MGANPLVARTRRPYASSVRFILPVVLLLGAAMYVVIIAFSEQLITATNPWYLVVPVAWNLLLFITTVITIVDGVLRVRAGKTRALAIDAMIVKLVAIPFFVLNFYVLAEFFIFGGLTIAFGIGLAFWVVVAIGGGLTYLTMLSTSVYLWAAIARLRRERIIGTGLTVLYMILSFLYVTDIAASVLVFGHSRRRPRLALVVLLLSVGALFVTYAIGTLTDGQGAGWNDPSIFLQWVIPLVIGGGLILATLIVSVIRRSTLRLEAERARVAAAATATTASPESESDTSDRELVG